jgi:hypothetical protein
MEKIPAQMTVVAISKPGGPEVLAQAWGKRNPGQGDGCGRQPA